MAPNWRSIKMAELANHSEVLWAYDEARFNPMALELHDNGFDELAHLAFFDGRRTPPLLEPLPTGWKQFGMMRSAPQGKIAGAGPSGKGLLLTSTEWIICWRWRPSVAGAEAYSALVQAQQQLRPRNLALVPVLVVPLIFLTHMARFPLGPPHSQAEGAASSPQPSAKDNTSPNGYSGARENSPTIKEAEDRGDTAARWLPVFRGSFKLLYPVVSHLYRDWLSGSTAEAKRYREGLGVSDPTQFLPDPQYLRSLQALLGEARLQALRNSPRLEPQVLALLDEASRMLWEREKAKSLKVSRAIEGLLPLYQWRYALPGPQGLSEAHLKSARALLNFWKEWRFQV